MPALGSVPLSVVIPALDEATSLGQVLADLGAIQTPSEVIIADGESTDGTPELAQRLGARIVRTAAGRGRQLAAGVADAQGKWLLIVHADARFSPQAARAVDRIVSADEPRRAYAFRFAIDAPNRAYRVLEWGTNLRARLAKLPFGDQGLLVRRADYDRAGGFSPDPIMEDVALIRRLRRVATLSIVDAPITVSPRRWKRTGILRSTLRNWSLLAAYSCGVSPHRLARFYRPRT